MNTQIMSDKAVLKTKGKPLKDNKNVIQSYLLTVAKFQSNIYAKRILLHIVKANQDYLKGEKLNGAINVSEDIFKLREYTLDIKSVLSGDEDKNYARIINAFHLLQDKFIRLDTDKFHVSVPFIGNLLIEKGSGVAKFQMSEMIYKAFTDYTKGFRKFEFQLTMSFNSVYSIRLYELMSGQKNPLTYTIDNLKEMFCIADKYINKPTNFIKRVIEPAQKELDEKSPYTFVYKINKKGRSFHSITFTPIFQPQYASEEAEKHELAKKVGSSAYLSRTERTYLNEHFQMSPKQIKNNHDTFFNAKKKHGDFLLNFLDKIRINAYKNNATNKIGYLISALKKDLENDLN